MSAGMLEKPTKIECKKSDLEARVLPLLRGRVFHVTKLQTFDSIRAEGIKNSRDSLPSSPWVNSYGPKRGWVCLFDLRNTTDAQVEMARSKYNFLRPPFSDADRNAHVYLFMSESVWPHLISWKCAEQEKAWGEMFIPDVEAWYPGDIPISCVSDALVVTIESEPESSEITRLYERSRKVRKLHEELFQKGRK
jgi:hypothetical protein